MKLEFGGRWKFLKSSVVTGWLCNEKHGIKYTQSCVGLLQNGACKPFRFPAQKKPEFDLMCFIYRNCPNIKIVHELCFDIEQRSQKL